MPKREPKISMQKLFSMLDYKPHTMEQWNAHTSTARFQIPCCGRRWGKSTLSSKKLLQGLFIPDSYYWIVGPDYSLGEKEFRMVYNDLHYKLGIGNQIRSSYNVKQGDMRIKMPWNSVLEVKSAERPKSLLGEGLHGVVMAEAARHDMSIWQQYIEPALTDHHGWAIFPSTPRGYNWYQGMWLLGQDPSMTDYESWRFPSWTNPIVYPEGRNDPEIRRIESVVSKGYFLQEYGAEFTSFEGQIYEDFDPMIHVCDIDYNPRWKNYLAFDFGFRDPFVCLDIMVDPSDNVYVWREYMVSFLSTWEHAVHLKNRENPDGYHVDGMFGDPRGADEIATIQLTMGNVYAPDVPWTQGIECIKRWVKLQGDGKPKLFFDRHGCPNTIRQFEQLRHKEVKEGQNVRKEGQHDYDDHGPDALRYFFGPYFVLGANSHLSDVYGELSKPSEGETFFQLSRGFTRQDSPIRFG